MPTVGRWKLRPNRMKVLNTIHTHYIDRIEFRGGSLQFVYEQYNSNRTAIRRPILTRIEVYDLQGVLRKTILLTQSIDTGYYLDENLAMMYGRYLNALTIDAQRYRFEYGAMHYGDSFSDFWGHARMGSYDRAIIRRSRKAAHPETVTVTD